MSWHARGVSLASRGGLVAVALLAIGLPLPYAFGFASGTYVLALAFVTMVALACSTAQSGQERRLFLSLFAIALAVRFYGHFALFSWSAAYGGPFLNPDSSTYLHRSLFLAADNFRHPLTPALFFGTYDCAHYYLFAAVIKFLRADLYALQLFNSALTALPGPLVFGALCVVLPRYALPVGLVITLSPTLVAFGINDLLKDPSVMASSMLAIWAMTRLARVKTVWGGGLLMLVSIAGLSYVRMSRFYVMPFLMAALIAALVLAWLLSRRRTAVSPDAALAPAMSPVRVGPSSRQLGVLLAVIFLAAEIVPLRLGWPISGMMVLDQVVTTLDTPAMRRYAGGLFDRARPGGESEAALAAAMVIPPRAVNEIMREFSSGRRMVAAIDQQQDLERRAVLDARARAAVALAAAHETEAVSAKTRIVRMGVNGFRKLFGPFPWIGPPSWHPQTVLTGDYLLFPGMLLWYAVLPFGVLGWLLVGNDLIRRRPVAIPLLFVAAVVCIFAAQYLVLNLSWRQRDFLFPFLAVLACVAIDQTWHRPLARRAYGLYWASLVLLAIGHITVRSYLT